MSTRTNFKFNQQHLFAKHGTTKNQNHLGTYWDAGTNGFTKRWRFQGGVAAFQAPQLWQGCPGCPRATEATKASLRESTWGWCQCKGRISDLPIFQSFLRNRLGLLDYLVALILNAHILCFSDFWIVKLSGWFLTVSVFENMLRLEWTSSKIDRFCLILMDEFT